VFAQGELLRVEMIFSDQPTTLRNLLVVNGLIMIGLRELPLFHFHASLVFVGLAGAMVPTQGV
jgi:hypothetical protein